MQWDREAAPARRKQQDRLLRTYVVHELYPFSPHYRKVFDDAGLAPSRIKGLADLAKVPPTSWTEVAAEPFEYILRPDEQAIARYGHRRLVLAVTMAKLRGGTAEVNRDVIDRAYKPIHWHLEDDTPIAYSRDDLDRLGEAGKRVMALAGLSRYDVLVDLSPPEPDLAYWQLVMGAREAGISALHLGPDPAVDLLVQAAPSVLSGRADPLIALLGHLEDAGQQLPDLHTILVAGELPSAAQRDLLEDLGRVAGRADLQVVAAWAPPGVRALWAECRTGRTLHTYPDFEWVEVVDGGERAGGGGELAWTALGWRGTVALRLRTGVHVRLDDSTCPGCGRLVPRLATTADLTAAALEVVASQPERVRAEPEPAPAARVRGDVAEEDEEDEAEAEVVTAAPPAPVGVGARVARTAAIPEELWILRDHSGVLAWQAEYRLVGDDEELLVFLTPKQPGHPGPLCRELDQSLQATQYIVLPSRDLDERVARDGPVVDLRV